MVLWESYREVDVVLEMKSYEEPWRCIACSSSIYLKTVLKKPIFGFKNSNYFKVLQHDFWWSKEQEHDSLYTLCVINLADFKYSSLLYQKYNCRVFLLST